MIGMIPRLEAFSEIEGKPCLTIIRSQDPEQIALPFGRAFFPLLLILLTFATGAMGQVTSLTMVSDPSDYIGSGQFYFFTPADGPFTAQSSSTQQVSISFHTPSYSQWWYLDFAALGGQTLSPGSYTGAARYPFQATTQPGLSVYGDGRGCNTLTGSFQVLQANFDSSGNVTAFDATFVQYCEGGTAALRGEIRYNAAVVVNLAAPTSLTAIEGQNQNFTVTATDSQSNHVSLTATGVPTGATFIDNGNNSGTFNWTPGVTRLGPTC